MCIVVIVCWGGAAETVVPRLDALLQALHMTVIIMHRTTNPTMDPITAPAIAPPEALQVTKFVHFNYFYKYTKQYRATAMEIIKKSCYPLDMLPGIKLIHLTDTNRSPFAKKCRLKY